MARYTKNGPNVTNTYESYTVTWYCKQVTDITVNTTTVDVTINIYAHFVDSAHIYGGDLNAALVVDRNVVNRANPQSDNWPSDGEDWHLISRKITYTRSTLATTHTISSYVQITGGAWEGTSSTYNDQLTVNVPVLPSYTVSYNANYGSGAPASQTKYYNQPLTLSSTKPTRTGHTFKGWSTSSSATAATYGAGGSYTANAGAVLYAVWQKNNYTLTYNPNGGAVSSTSKTVAYQAAYGSLPTPTRDGYNFLGWYTASTGGTVVKATDTMGAGNVTIYAHWEKAYTAPTVTITEARRDTTSHTGDGSGTVPYVSFVWTSGDDDGTVVTPSSYDVIFTNQEDSTDFESVTNQTITVSPVSAYFDNITLDTGKAYDVKVILHISGYSNIESALGYISQSYFIMDINPDGTAIGFGREIGDNDVGYYFAGNVNVENGTYKLNGDNLTPSDLGEVDYIITQGASTGWYYRKWKSGRVEAWGIATFTARTGEAWGTTHVYYYDFPVTIPAGIFTTAPLRGYASGTNFQWMPVGVSIASTTSCSVRMIKPVSTSQNGGVYLYLLSF